MMTLFTASLLGGLGAVLRMEMDGLVGRHLHWRFPLGIFVVNVTACFALGVVTGLSLSHVVSAQTRYLLGSGFLGGYSTFSTASLEGVQQLREGHVTRALCHTGGMLVFSAVFAWLGMVLAG